MLEGATGEDLLTRFSGNFEVRSLWGCGVSGVVGDLTSHTREAV